MDRIKQTTQNIYVWTVGEDGKICPPEMVLPECVIERVHFFGKCMADGMRFAGVIDCIMAYDEQKMKEAFSAGAYEEWLPVSEEFKEWRDDWVMESLHQMEISVAVIYGMGQKIESRFKDEN